MLNEVKHLANVSCQVPARDSSDATLCQNDTQRGEKAFMDNIYIIAKIYPHRHFRFRHRFRCSGACSAALPGQK